MNVVIIVGTMKFGCVLYYSCNNNICCLHSILFPLLCAFLEIVKGHSAFCQGATQFRAIAPSVKALLGDLVFLPPVLLLADGLSVKVA